MPDHESTDAGRTKLWVLGSAVLLVIALVVYSQLPERKADLNQAYYTDDDGQTWFADSASQVPPFLHNTKTAVSAQVFSYAGGSKFFCAYMMQFTPAGKQQLEASQAAARSAGKPPAAASLYQDPVFLRNQMQVKRPGPTQQWVSCADKQAPQLMSVHAPDGSEVDQLFVH